MIFIQYYVGIFYPNGRANLTSSASSQPVQPVLQYAFTGHIVTAKATLVCE